MARNRPVRDTILIITGIALVIGVTVFVAYVQKVSFCNTDLTSYADGVQEPILSDNAVKGAILTIKNFNRKPDRASKEIVAEAQQIIGEYCGNQESALVDVPSATP